MSESTPENYFSFLPEELIVHDFLYLPSTQTYLEELISQRNEDFKEPIICRARIQTEGRGRRLNTWWSESPKNLYFSILLPLKNSCPSYFSLIIGIRICSLLRELGIDAKIKWPNDIFVGPNKVAGILLNVKKKAQKEYLIIGVGINISEAPLLKESFYGAASLSEFQKKSSNSDEIFLAIINKIRKDLLDLHFGFKICFDPGVYMGFDFLKDKRVKIENHIGLVKGVDSFGCLLLLPESGNGTLLKIISGDLQVLDEI